MINLLCDRSVRPQVRSRRWPTRPEISRSPRCDQRLDGGAIRRSRRGRLSWDGGRLIVRDGEGPSPGRLACAVPSLASVTARCSTGTRVARLAFSGRVLARGRVPFRSRGVGTLANASAPMLRMVP